MLPNGGESVLFFDELTSAQPLQQTTAYQGTLDIRIGEYKVSDVFFVIPVGNNQTDRGGAYSISTAYANDVLAFPMVVSKLSSYLVNKRFIGERNTMRISRSI